MLKSISHNQKCEILIGLFCLKQVHYKVLQLSKFVSSTCLVVSVAVTETIVDANSNIFNTICIKRTSKPRKILNHSNFQGWECGNYMCYVWKWKVVISDTKLQISTSMFISKWNGTEERIWSSPFPCCLVNRQWLRKKTQTEKKCYFKVFALVLFTFEVIVL